MKVALMLNTNSLGGAERSVIEQLNLVNDRITLSTFVPSLSGNNEKILGFIEKKLNASVKFYRIPKIFYKIHQKSGYGSLIKATFSLISSPLYFNDLAKLKEKDILYCNGNKIAIWTLLWGALFNYKGKIVWHFRDYPSKNKMFIFFITKMLNRFQSRLTFVANSYSVARALTDIGLNENEISVIYNTVGNEIKAHGKDDSIKHIGVVAMMASWKGIHQVLLMAHLYEKELKEIGIETISIFSSDIYQTSGDHMTYDKELKDLLKKFPSSLVTMKPNLTPENIFSTIDLLIHPSLSAEPFGRVILEAFRSNVPVISTSMGGALELIDSGKNGLTFFKYDYAGLFNQIKKLSMDNNLRQSLTQNAYRKSFEIEEKVKMNLLHLLGVS